MGSEEEAVEKADIQDEIAGAADSEGEEEEDEGGHLEDEHGEDQPTNFADILGPDCIIRRVDKDKNVIGTAQPDEMQREVMHRASAQKRLGAVAEHVKTMTRAQKLDWALDLKSKANQEYSANRFEDAAKLYNDCLCALDFDGSEEEQKEVKVKLQLPACTNLAACMIEMGEYTRCIEICDIALSVDASSAKALYRRGLAYYRLGNYTKARPDFEKSLQSVTAERESCNSEEQLRTLNDLTRRITVYLGHIRSFYKDEKDRCRQMFQAEKSIYEDRKGAGSLNDASKAFVDDSDEAIEAALARILGDWRCCICCKRRSATTSAQASRKKTD
mmetsp:Transcript_22813/g.53293  ORF Transcript_22813/g.53293 Transcript_22813/m.53293 type:complete len:331 (-) Transcript_22813:14-1006(-)